MSQNGVYVVVLYVVQVCGLRRVSGGVGEEVRTGGEPGGGACGTVSKQHGQRQDISIALPKMHCWSIPSPGNKHTAHSIHPPRSEQNPEKELSRRTLQRGRMSL